MDAYDQSYSVDIPGVNRRFGTGVERSFTREDRPMSSIIGGGVLGGGLGMFAGQGVAGARSPWVRGAARVGGALLGAGAGSALAYQYRPTFSYSEPEGARLASNPLTVAAPIVGGAVSGGLTGGLVARAGNYVATGNPVSATGLNIGRGVGALVGAAGAYGALRRIATQAERANQRWRDFHHVSGLAE